MDLVGAWAIVLCTAVVSAVFWLWRDTLPFWALFAGIVIGTAMITVGIWVNGERDGGAAALNEMYYVWPVVFTAYYFSVRLLVAEIALAATLYAGVLLALDPGSIGVTRWLIVVTVLVGVGGLISRLQARVEELVDRLSDTARRDPLTGLLNRRGFEEQLDAELSLATRSERSLALVVGDLDHFKTVNDRLGHPAGDAVLQRVAGILSRVSRRGDTVARMGGEEFVLIVADADSQAAYELAERARKEIEAAFADEPVALTISCGAVSFPANGTTAESLMAAADGALYAAKHGGCNRTARPVDGPGLPIRIAAAVGRDPLHGLTAR